MTERLGQKRSAIEPVEALLSRDDELQHVSKRRPASVTLGAVFVFARALAGVLWIGGFTLLWPQIRTELTLEADVDVDIDGLVYWIIVGGGLLGVLVLVVLGIAILLGSNLARVLIMLGLTLSTVSAAIGYFVDGEQITIRTTLLTVALDILVLLALSSRDARAWTRSPRRTRGPHSIEQATAR